MGLPFLPKDKQTGIIVHKKRNSENSSIETKIDNEISDLEVAAQDILRAIESKDAKQLASAIRAAFELMDASPHVEGEHINE